MPHSACGRGGYVSTYLKLYYRQQVAQLAQISFTLFRQMSLSSITPSRSSSLHLVSIQSSCNVLGCSTLAHPCEGVHRKTSLMFSFLLLQQCLTCLVCLIWMVLKIRGGWSYYCCFVGCCFQDLFYTARSILVHLLSSFSLSAFIWCICTVELTQLLFGRNRILFYQID